MTQLLGSRVMRVDDIVKYQDTYWLVGRTAEGLSLTSWDGVCVPGRGLTDREVEVVGNYLNWPFIAAPRRRHVEDGHVVQVSRTRRGRTTVLVPLRHWVPSHWLRAGGSVFFNPALRLGIGEVLVALHSSGRLSRLTVTRAFGSVKLRKARIAPKPVPPTRADRLLNDDWEID